MNETSPSCLVILAGGQSRRMGRDKAVVDFQGQRLVDRLIDRFQSEVAHLFLSASQNFDTDIINIPDAADAPAGPVGAIFSIASYLAKNHPEVYRFYTVPVDAPFAPLDLLDRLESLDQCTVAAAAGRLQPTFAQWQCSIVNSVILGNNPKSKAPSLHRLSEQCHSQVVTWSTGQPFANINTPDDLTKATILD